MYRSSPLLLVFPAFAVACASPAPTEAPPADEQTTAETDWSTVDCGSEVSIFPIVATEWTPEGEVTGYEPLEDGARLRVDAGERREDGTYLLNFALRWVIEGGPTVSRGVVGGEGVMTLIDARGVTVEGDYRPSFGRSSLPDECAASEDSLHTVYVTTPSFSVGQGEMLRIGWEVTMGGDTSSAEDDVSAGGEITVLADVGE